MATAKTVPGEIEDEEDNGGGRGDKELRPLDQVWMDGEGVQAFMPQ